MKYMALQDSDDTEPYGLIRYDENTGAVERCNGGDEWQSSPWHGRYVVGGDTGAHEVSETEARQIAVGGTITKLTDKEVAALGR